MSLPSGFRPIDSLTSSTRWWVGLLGLFLATGAGLGLLGFGVFPLSSLEEQAAAAAGDGTVDRFASMMEQLRFRARVCSGLFLVLALAVSIVRSRVEEFVDRIVRSVGPVKKDLLLWSRRLAAERTQVVVLILITLLGAGVRAEFLTVPVFTDEAQTFTKSVLQPFYVGLSYYENPNNHLLNTFLGHLANLSVGNEPWVLRLPSFVAGTLSVPAAYLFFRMHFDKDTGLGAAGLMAINVPLIIYSSQARGYSFLIFLFLAALFLAGWLIRREHAAVWLMFSVVSAVGAYALPLMIYPFGICLLWIVLSYKAASEPLPWLAITGSVVATGILTLYLYLPVVLVSGPMALIPGQL